MGDSQNNLSQASLFYLSQIDDGPVDRDVKVRSPKRTQYVASPRESSPTYDFENFPVRNQSVSNIFGNATMLEDTAAFIMNNEPADKSTIYNYENLQEVESSCSVDRTFNYLSPDETSGKLFEMRNKTEESLLQSRFGFTKPSYMDLKLKDSSVDVTNRVNYLKTLPSWSNFEIYSSRFEPSRMDCSVINQTENEEVEEELCVSDKGFVSLDYNTTQGEISSVASGIINVNANRSDELPLNIDTFYECEKIYISPPEKIEEYCRTQNSLDWNKEIDNIIGTMNTEHVLEPNLEYLEYVAVQEKSLEITKYSVGDKEDTIRLDKNDEDGLEEEELNENEEEIEKAFSQGGFSTSTPTRTVHVDMEPEEELQSPQQRMVSTSLLDNPGDLEQIVVTDLEQNWLLYFSDIENEDFKSRKQQIQEKIEELLESLLESVKKQEPLKLEIKSDKCDNCSLGRKCSKATKKTINFMVNSSERRFTIIVYIIGEIYKFLSTNTTCTKRELYYRNVDFLRSQNEVNRSINDICLLLEANPWELGIISTSKGLIAGDLKIICNDYELSFESVGQVPNNVSEIETFQSTAEFVLVVEKDTVFQRLINQRIFEKMGKQFILITGKGYPDINTRLLVKKLYDIFLIPVYVLVDGDPHGIEIMLNYRFGSFSMCYLSESLSVPKLKWIGIHPSEIEMFNIPKIPLTKNEEKKLSEMMTRPYVDEAVKTELQILLTKKNKAEIEGILDFSNNFIIDDYIPNKIRRNLV